MLTQEELQQIKQELSKRPGAVIGGRLTDDDNDRIADVIFEIKDDMLSIGVQYWTHSTTSNFLKRLGSLHSYLETADKDSQAWSHLLAEVDRVVNDPDVLMFTN